MKELDMPVYFEKILEGLPNVFILVLNEDVVVVFLELYLAGWFRGLLIKILVSF